MRQHADSRNSVNFGGDTLIDSEEPLPGSIRVENGFMQWQEMLTDYASLLHPENADNHFLLLISRTIQTVTFFDMFSSHDAVDTIGHGTQRTDDIQGLGIRFVKNGKSLLQCGLLTNRR